MTKHYVQGIVTLSKMDFSYNNVSNYRLKCAHIMLSVEIVQDKDIKKMSGHYTSVYWLYRVYTVQQATEY